MTLEKYDSMCGLSQDEYRKFLKLRHTYHNIHKQLSEIEYTFMIECLETIAEHRANQIEDLLEQVG
jgi:hypothetical protein